MAFVDAELARHGDYIMRGKLRIYGSLPPARNSATAFGAFIHA